MIRTLHIEDDDLDAAAVEGVLRRPRFGLSRAPSYTAARRLLREQTFDLVLADFRLPDGAGVDFIEHAPDTPLVVLSGVGDLQSAIDTMRAGAADYVYKDLDKRYLDVLPVCLEQAVERRARRERKRLEAAAADRAQHESEVFEGVAAFLTNGLSVPLQTTLHACQAVVAARSTDIATQQARLAASAAKRADSLVRNLRAYYMLRSHQTDFSMVACQEALDVVVADPPEPGWPQARVTSETLPTLLGSPDLIQELFSRIIRSAQIRGRRTASGRSHARHAAR